MTKVLVPLADGVEEMEAVIILDVLRRAGWEAIACSIGNRTIHASRHVIITADTQWDAVLDATFDLIVIPGGSDGSAALSSHPGVLERLRNHAAHNRLIGAVCAAPLVLQAAGLTEGRTLTSHPSVKQQLLNVTWLNQRVVVDNTMVTSQGPGTTFDFALALVSLVQGNEAAKRISAGLIL